MLYSSHFWFGAFIGAMVGGSLGAVMMAVFSIGKDSNHWPPGPDEPELQRDATLVPDQRHFSDERIYRR